MSGKEHSAIPVIDISSLLTCSENKPNTIKEIAEALLEYGFFYVTNHGIEESLQKDVFQHIKAFFDLPQEKKNEIHKAKGSYRGYFAMKEEVSTKTRAADWKEGIYYFRDFEMSDRPERVFSGKNPWPNEAYVPGFTSVIEEYFQRTMALGSTLMSAVAIGLGLDEDFFTTKFQHDPFAQLGIFHYPPYNHNDQDKWGVQEHTDYGVITVLMQDDVGGLQVQLKDGTWIEAPPIPNNFIINIGDALEVWTSGAYSPRLHRVRTSKTQHRYSIPMFYDPSFDCVIDKIPIKNTVIPLHCTKNDLNVDFPFNYGDYVLKKYQTIIPDKP